VVKTPLPPALVEPAAPPREPWFFETLFKEYVIDVLRDIKDGIIEVATDIYVFIRDYHKPVPLTPLESLLKRHEAIQTKYDGITKKYWDTNSHLLDDNEVFLQIYGSRVGVANKGFEVLGGRLKRKCSIFNIQNMVTE
jgi:hypothetical protein